MSRTQLYYFNQLVSLSNCLKFRGYKDPFNSPILCLLEPYFAPSSPAKFFLNLYASAVTLNNFQLAGSKFFLPPDTQGEKIHFFGFKLGPLALPPITLTLRAIAQFVFNAKNKTMQG